MDKPTIENVEKLADIVAYSYTEEACRELLKTYLIGIYLGFPNVYQQDLIDFDAASFVL